MGQSWQEGWDRSTRGAQTARGSSTPEYGSPATDTGHAEAGRRKLWLSGQSLELYSGGKGDRADVWGGVPPSACQSNSQRTRLDTAKAHPTSQTAPGRRDSALERGALARVEKKALAEGRTTVFIDESGFYLLPMVVRTYAPRGCTPILREFLSYSHLSAIGAVTPQGKLFLKSYEHSISSREVVACLQQLQRLIPGLLLVIWDGSPTHRSKAIKAYLAAGAAKRIHWSNFLVMRLS